MAASARDQVAQMARYHRWATERLLAAVAEIPGETLSQAVRFVLQIDPRNPEPPAADRQRDLVSAVFRTGHDQPALDTELESDRTVLASRLIAATTRWVGYLEHLDDAALARDLHFVMTTGQARVLPMSGALLHVFNHATHHRGQVTAAVTMLGFDYPPLDLPYLIFSELA